MRIFSICVAHYFLWSVTGVCTSVLTPDNIFLMAHWRAAFPKTLEALEKQGLGEMIQAFEFELQFQQLRLDLRWFPVFLKMQNSPDRLLMLAEFEYLRAAVYTQEMGAPRLDPGMIGLNPSAQFLEVREELPEIGRGPGLYCFVKEGSRFFEMELSLPQALLLDLLREDRKYTREQLLVQAEIHQVKLPLSNADWQRTLSTLLERSVILQGANQIQSLNLESAQSVDELT